MVVAAPLLMVVAARGRDGRLAFRLELGDERIATANDRGGEAERDRERGDGVGPARSLGQSLAEDLLGTK